MPGIFKKLSAADVKITPFEAHKQFNTTILTSIGATTESLAWSGKNKSTFSTGSRLYYQLDKLYYRNYIRERALRLELDDATYTTQERRLYQSASVLSLSQKTFGSEIQPSSLELSGSKNSLQFNIRDDGFGNIYDITGLTAGVQYNDNFPNEDYRLLYLGPVQGFKRADLTLDYEKGYNYVNNPFPNGYKRTVYDDSYFLNEIEFNHVNFVTSSNSGFHAVKTPKAPYQPTSSVDLQALYNASAITVAPNAGSSLYSTSGDASKLFDGNKTTTVITSTYNIDGGSASDVDAFTITFDPPYKTNTATVRAWSRGTEDGTTLDIYINADPNTSQSFVQSEGLSVEQKTATFDVGSTLNSITFSGKDTHTGPPSIPYHQFIEVELDIAPLNEITPFVKIPHQPQFNFENDDDFTINFYYDLNSIDYTNTTTDGDYFILTKEGTKYVPALPSEGTQHTPLSKTGSAKITTAPAGPQFPYRIYYKGNHPSANTSSIFFERSDGEVTQFVSASFHLSGSTENQKFISCRNDDGVLKLRVNSEAEASSSGQNSPILEKTVSNKANITLYNKPNPDGSYSNFIGYKGGQISQLMMWGQTLSLAELTNISESVVGTPYIGNIFYDNGFVAITHPKYMDVFDGGELNILKYKNTHLITENEYQCTMTEDEFEFTTNNSIRKIPFSDSEDIADFVTGSQFKPYVTSIGLYDDNGNLLVFGKLGQPIKASSETDTTFVIRFDT